MEIDKEMAEQYLHKIFIAPNRNVNLNSDEEIETRSELWGALGVFRNLGVLSQEECQSVLNQAGLTTSEAQNL